MKNLSNGVIAAVSIKGNILMLTKVFLQILRLITVTLKKMKKELGLI